MLCGQHHEYIFVGDTPKVVEHIAKLIIGHEDEVPRSYARTRGEMINEARRLAAGPMCEEVRAGETPNAQYWERALWLCCIVLDDIDTNDVVAAALRKGWF